jgi:hypothetical protein
LPRKDILSKFGITDRSDLRVQVITEQDNPSMVDVHSPRDPAKTSTPKQATELSILLRVAGEEARGQEIAVAAAKAQEAIALGRRNSSVWAADGSPTSSISR